MQSSEIIIQAEHVKIQNWPHARPDCPSLWKGSNSPCSSCFCYVCDVPIHSCDDIASHAAGNGRTPYWVRAKRHRRALTNTWSDIPDLVDLLVSLSVTDSYLKDNSKNSNGVVTSSPTAVIDIADEVQRGCDVKRNLDFDTIGKEEPKRATAINTNRVALDSNQLLIAEVSKLKIKKERMKEEIRQ